MLVTLVLLAQTHFFVMDVDSVQTFVLTVQFHTLKKKLEVQELEKLEDMLLLMKQYVRAVVHVQLHVHQALWILRDSQIDRLWRR